MITILTFVDRASLSERAAEALKTEKLFLQSALHPCAGELLALRPDAASMDDLYERSADFDALNNAIADRLIAAGDCTYAMMGGISLSQTEAIRQKCGESDTAVTILPGIRLADAAFPEEPRGRVFSAHGEFTVLDQRIPVYIEETDSPLIAGEIKLALMEYYPDEWPVRIARLTAGGFAYETAPLYAIDRLKAYDASLTLYLAPVPFERQTRYGFEDLIAIIRRLRQPDGCPWDKVQTHDSLKKDLLEECYELYDAIEENDDNHMAEELGDVLMHVLFHSVIGEEQCAFTARDVTTGIVSKLIYRHPHIFGEVIANTPEEVKANWEDLKMAEKGQETETAALRSVTRSLPSLMFAKKIQKKAAHAGFDWDSAEAAFYKIGEETQELREAMDNGTNVEEEMGDLLFSVVNVARLLHLEPEMLLRQAADKFTDRFARMEDMVLVEGKVLKNMTLAEMDVYWDKAKAQE